MRQRHSIVFPLMSRKVSFEMVHCRMVGANVMFCGNGHIDTTQVTNGNSVFNFPLVTGANLIVDGVSGTVLTGLGAQVNPPYINLLAEVNSGSTPVSGAFSALSL